MRIFDFSLFVFLLSVAPAFAQCRIALALAVDVSRSVDAADYVIQTEGLAEALTDPAVEAAIFGVSGEVAIAVYHWSGRRYQEIVADWRVIDSPETLAALAETVRATPRFPAPLPTALGEALLFGLDLFETAPRCEKRVLDVAGDGRNNDGLPPQRIYARSDFGDLVINGLAIGEHESDLTEYYRNEVIRGDSAFVEVAVSQTDYPRAIRRKLIRELSETVSENKIDIFLPERVVFLTKVGGIQH